MNAACRVFQWSGDDVPRDAVPAWLRDVTDYPYARVRSVNGKHRLVAEHGGQLLAIAPGGCFVLDIESGRLEAVAQDEFMRRYRRERQPVPFQGHELAEGEHEILAMGCKVTIKGDCQDPHALHEMVSLITNALQGGA